MQVLEHAHLKYTQIYKIIYDYEQHGGVQNKANTIELINKRMVPSINSNIINKLIYSHSDMTHNTFMTQTAVVNELLKKGDCGNHCPKGMSLIFLLMYYSNKSSVDNIIIVKIIIILLNYLIVILVVVIKIII